MDCTKVQEQILDNMGSHSANAELSAHLAGCADCAQLWQAMSSTSAAMDAWAAPEPSPYFSTRFQARLAEVKRDEANAPASAFAWLRHGIWRPALAGAMTLAIAVGIGFYERPTAQVEKPSVTNTVSPAVNDLQKLDKNEDLYADFEMLDDLQTPSQPANTNTTTKTDTSKTEL